MSLKEKIKRTAEASIRRFFLNKQVTTTHILDKLFPRERRIRSLIGGLETSLGTKLWEPLAKSLADENDFTILNEVDFNKAKVPQNIPAELLSCLDKWKRKREEYSGANLDRYIEELRAISRNIDLNNIELGKMPKGQGIDIWLEKDGVEYLFDIKTNQINAGSGPKYNETLMRWYLYRIMLNPDIKIKCQIAFPFNPYPNDFWRKAKGVVAPLIPQVDALVENEFWDFLSGENDTWNIVSEAFDELASEGFGDTFNDIFEPPNN